jgi:hypothetical protein
MAELTPEKREAFEALTRFTREGQERIISALREATRRRRGDEGEDEGRDDDTGGARVREPRRPPKGGGGLAVELLIPREEFSEAERRDQPIGAGYPTGRILKSA